MLTGDFAGSSGIVESACNGYAVRLVVQSERSRNFEQACALISSDVIEFSIRI
jgi:hypothetical protein